MIQLVILTPETSLYRASVLSVVVMTASGEITILSDHEPLIATLVAGELRATTIDDETVSFAIGQGVVEVNANMVTVLVNATERVEDIDEARAYEALDRAQRAMQQVSLVGDDLEHARLQSIIERNMNRLRLRRKRNN